MGLKASIVAPMAAKQSRQVCTLKPDVCERLVKEYLSPVDFTCDVYKDDDYEVVVAHYLKFLCAVAEQTTRLNPTVVAVAVVRAFALKYGVAKMFSEAMAHAFSYCWSKGQKAVSGAKLSKPVLSVLQAFNLDDVEQPAKAPRLSIKGLSSSSVGTAATGAATDAASIDDDEELLSLI